QAKALNRLNAILQSTIATIQLHMANFPISTLQAIRARVGGGGTVDTPAGPVPGQGQGTGIQPGATGVKPATDGPAGGGGTASGPVAGTVLISLSSTDLDALARVAQSEVGHFGKYGKGQLSGGIG